MADPELMIRCERAEAEGFLSLVNAIEEGLKTELGIATTRIAGAPVWSCKAIPWMLFNRTIALGLHEECTLESLDEISKFYCGASHGIELSPLAPSLGADELRRRGYMPEMERPKFVRSSEPQESQNEVRVRIAGSSDAERFAEVMASSFGFPDEAKSWPNSLVRTSTQGRTCFVAELEGQIVGTAFLYCHEEIGWLGGGCCLPDFRGRGVQRALIEARSAHAHELGCSQITAETNSETAEEPGYSMRNMLKSGFELAYHRQQFVWSN